LAASSASALSPFHFCLLARTVALLFGCRRGLLSGIPPQEEPVLGLGLLLLRLRLPGAVRRGAGRGAPLTFHDRQRQNFMTGSDKKRVNLTNPAQPCRVKKIYILKILQSPCRAKNDIYAGCYRKSTVGNPSEKNQKISRVADLQHFPFKWLHTTILVCILLE